MPWLLAGMDTKTAKKRKSIAQVSFPKIDKFKEKKTSIIWVVIITKGSETFLFKT